MASKVAGKMKSKMTSLDKLLGVPETEGFTSINIESIHAFKNHPFKVLDNEDMANLVESISANGILNPVILRPSGNGQYEMISGHRRLHAAKKVGLLTVPAIVKEISDEEATIMMVDSNIQREEILLSEKAFAYKMRYEAMKKQGKRSDLTSSPEETKLRADEQLARDMGESRNQIQRIMKLTDLIEELLDMADSKILPLKTAVEMAYCPSKTQKLLLDYITKNSMIPLDKMAAFRKDCDVENVSYEDVEKYFSPVKKPTPKKEEKRALTLSDAKLNKYFPKEMSSSECEKIIYKLLDDWKKNSNK